jgi:hypothetical protein
MARSSPTPAGDRRPEQGLDRARHGVSLFRHGAEWRTTIAFKKAVLKLEVTPQITPEGDIILDLDVNKDSRGETTTQASPLIPSTSRPRCWSKMVAPW